MRKSNTQFEYVNEPEPEFRIEQVGDDPRLVYTIDWEQQDTPTAQHFDAISTAEVKVVVAMSSFDDPEVIEKAEAAHDALSELQQAMADARGVDYSDVMMGLDALPEVTRRE